MVTSCVLLSKADGRVVLRDEEALAWITRQGKLEWQMEDEAEALAPPTLPPQTPPRLPPPGPGLAREDHVYREEYTYEEGPLPAPLTVGKSQLAIIPQRTEKGRFVPGNTLTSREHRQILGLVDGQRNVQEIAQLLHRPADFILRVLQELQAAGFII